MGLDGTGTVPESLVQWMAAAVGGLPPDHLPGPIPEIWALTALCELVKRQRVSLMVALHRLPPQGQGLSKEIRGRRQTLLSVLEGAVVAVESTAKKIPFC